MARITTNRIQNEIAKEAAEVAEAEALDNANDPDVDKAAQEPEVAAQASSNVEAAKEAGVALDESLEDAPEGIVVEDQKELSKHAKEGLFDQDVFLKVVPWNSSRPTYILLAAKGTAVRL